PRTIVADYESETQPTIEVETPQQVTIETFKSIIQEEVMRHPNYQDARTPEDIANCIPPVIVRVIDFNESGLQLRTTIYSKNNAEGFAMLSDLRISIKKRFDQEGISFPYPHRTVVMK
ncbi:MAG: mechanosensitive ion channel family protein, partial [Longicatena sp.]